MTNKNPSEVGYIIRNRTVVGKRTIIYHPEKSVILNCFIGNDCKIHAPVWIGNDVVIRDNCKVQALSFLPDGITLEEDVFIGPGVVFTNDKHPPSGELLGTCVCKGASIGANVTILPHIRIGENAKVGAGSVVTKDIPDNETWFGNPAKKYEKM